MALFVGEFEAAIDAKHRMAIPSALRDGMDPQEDGENFILLVGPDRHLRLYPDKLYKQMLAKLRISPLPDRQAQKMDLLFAMARLVKMDAQGRLVLPEKSMQRAAVGPNVTLVGQYDHVQVWPTDEWNTHVEASLPSYGEMLYEAADRLQKEGTA